MTISCFPCAPELRWFKLSKIFRHLGVRAIGPSKRDDIPRIWISNKPKPDLRRKSSDINANMTDSSKRWTERLFRDVFGYGYGIDPRMYDGLAVEKSDQNGYSHGELVRCPREPVPKMFYSRFLDGPEWRVQFYDNIICVTSVQRERVNGFPKKTRAPGTSRHNVEPSDHFSEDELLGLRTLALRSGMDYGGMDVIRDRDGRIYVVDLNPGPSGPYREAFPADVWPTVIPVEAEMFRAAFLS